QGRGLRLRRLEVGPSVGGSRRGVGGAAGAAVVPSSLRHRDELPADAPVPGADDGEGPVLPAAAGGSGAAAASGVGVADGAGSAGPRAGLRRVGGGVAAAAAARLAGGSPA